jgi:acyl-CoA synthetase (AMP-forming)/AMP-acid ligase II
MVYTPPSWVPRLNRDIPDSIPICDFMLDDKYGRFPLKDSRPFFTDGVSGESLTPFELKDRVDYLARGLSQELGWHPNQGTEWDKVIAVFSANAIDTLPLAWATHRLGGIQSPANAQYSVAEVAYQLKNSKAKCVFTCLPLLKATLEATEKVGIPKNRVYLIELPKALTGDVPDTGFKTVSQLVEQGKKLPKLEPLKWSKGEGARRTAFLCYSSGTSGLPVCQRFLHPATITLLLTILRKES